MSSPRKQLITLIEQGAIPTEKTEAALSATGISPAGSAWRSFIDRLLLWFGGLALAFAVMFFVAYNWDDLGRFAKFGMVEGVIVLAIAAFCKFDLHSTASKVSLLVATICLGVLLALYGQTYQTGADPWQLFFNWALLMLPWAIIGRFPAIWIVWVLLINISIVLYHQAFRGMFWFVSGSQTDMLWLIFIFNTLLLAAWEFLAEIWHWLAERWAVRLLATGSGFSISWLVLHNIFTRDDGSFWPGLVWMAWLVSIYFFYRKTRPDLFMLAGCCLSVITITVTFLGKHMLDSGDAGSFLFLALLVIGMGAGSAFWLKGIHQECRT
jgi:uncharacterized membrane protein